MVQNTGKTLCTDTLKPVNMPEPVYVEEDSHCLPAAVRMKRRQAIIAIENRWRIDDEWWRSEPIARFYFAVLFSSGQRLVLYKDLTDNQWYKQAS